MYILAKKKYIYIYIHNYTYFVHHKKNIEHLHENPKNLGSTKNKISQQNF